MRPLLIFIAIGTTAYAQLPIVAANLSVDLNLEKEERVFISQEIAKDWRKHRDMERLKSELYDYIGDRRRRRHNQETFQQYLEFDQPLEAFEWAGYELTTKQRKQIKVIAVKPELLKKIRKAEVRAACEAVIGVVTETQLAELIGEPFAFSERTAHALKTPDPRVDLIRIAMHPSVQTEINLTVDRVKTVAKLRRELVELKVGERGIHPDECDAITAKYRAAMKAELDADQFRRLEQLEWQFLLLNFRYKAALSLIGKTSAKMSASTREEYAKRARGAVAEKNNIKRIMKVNWWTQRLEPIVGKKSIDRLCGKAGLQWDGIARIKPLIYSTPLQDLTKKPKGKNRRRNAK